MSEPTMCNATPAAPLASETGVLAKLKDLSAAEEFFDALGVKYDAGVLAVARMHIMKRMGEYLGSDDLDGLPDRVVLARCRSCLERAYQDFVELKPP